MWTIVRFSKKMCPDSIRRSRVVLSVGHLAVLWNHEQIWQRVVSSLRINENLIDFSHTSVGLADGHADNKRVFQRVFLVYWALNLCSSTSVGQPLESINSYGQA